MFVLMSRSSHHGNGQLFVFPQLDSMDLQLPNGLPDGVPHISGNHNNSKLVCLHSDLLFFVWLIMHIFPPIKPKTC